MTQAPDSLAQISAKSKTKIQLQLVLAVLVIIGYGIYAQSWHGAVSVAYGAAIILLFSVLLLWDVVRASKTAAESPQRSMIVLYVGAVVRFVLVMVLFTIGVKLFGLDVKEILIGFVATIIANVFVAARS